MSNFKLIAISESNEPGELSPASIKVSTSTDKWLCNILSTGYIVFNSETDHSTSDVKQYLNFSKNFHTLFNNIKSV